MPLDNETGLERKAREPRAHLAQSLRLRLRDYDSYTPYGRYRALPWGALRAFRERYMRLRLSKELTVIETYIEGELNSYIDGPRAECVLVGDNYI